MTITNGYCTLAELQSEASTSAAGEVTKMEVAIAAASRQIDGYCDRRFWQDATVVDRVYWADDARTVYVDDISTTTGLVVKCDDNDDGTFATTLTINTDFILLDANAADMVPVWPYTQLRIVGVNTLGFPVFSSGRPGVQVTAKFGWPAIPDDIRKACIIQAHQLWKAKDAVFGGLSFGDSGFMRVRDTMNPMAAALLEPYCRPRVA